MDSQERMLSLNENISTVSNPSTSHQSLVMPRLEKSCTLKYIPIEKQKQY